MVIPKTLILLATTVALSGCTTFGCKGFPSSPICKSAVDAYHDTDDRASSAEEVALQGSPFLLGHPDALRGLKTDPRVMRIWVAPWEDRDGDLQTASYLLTEPNRKPWQSDPKGLHPERLHPLQVSTR